jgi:hypothetical protein
VTSARPISSVTGLPVCAMSFNHRVITGGAGHVQWLVSITTAKACALLESCFGAQARRGRVSPDAKRAIRANIFDLAVCDGPTRPRQQRARWPSVSSRQH